MPKTGNAANDLEAQMDALYAAPLAEFVEARNALAKSLGAAGRKEDAARVKALAKPSAAAWAVNQLAFSSPRLLDALVAAGDRLRAKPSDVKEAMRARRDALNEAAKAAERVVSGAGRSANPDVSRRISATLEAIATYGRAPGAPAAGRLAEDVAAPGFDEIASLGLLGRGSAGHAAGAHAGRPTPTPAPGPPPKAPLPPPPPRALRPEQPKTPSKKNLARERALEEKRRREDARRAAALEKDVRTARARLAAAEKALAAAGRRRAAVEQTLTAAKAAETGLAGAASQARAALEAAERARADEAKK